MALNANFAPEYYGVLTPNIVGSLLIREEGDPLREQRDLAYEALHRALEIKNEFQTTGQHELITPDMIRFGITCHDYTSLRPRANEIEEFMQRMAGHAGGFFPQGRTVPEMTSRGFCSREDKIAMALPVIAQNTALRGAFVSGSFPGYYKTPDSVRKDIERKAELVKDTPNAWDYDSVLLYHDWMDGDHKKVQKILEAEAKACREHGFLFKAIQKISVHAYGSKNTVYGNDYFASVYHSTMMALEAGADCAKTSTGLAAMRPYEHFISKDDGHIAKAMPMLVALRDFNATTGEKRWPKFSGGNENEADVAVFYQATRDICGKDIADAMCIGAGYSFKLRLMRALYEMEGSKSGLQYSDFGPHNLEEIQSLPVHQTGLPDPAKADPDAPMPPELRRFVTPEIVPAETPDVPGI